LTSKEISCRAVSPPKDIARFWTSKKAMLKYSVILFHKRYKGLNEPEIGKI
jgi:hypothetical protein